MMDNTELHKFVMSFLHYWWWSVIFHSILFSFIYFCGLATRFFGFLDGDGSSH